MHLCPPSRILCQRRCCESRRTCSAALSSGGGCAKPDPVDLTQECVRQLEHDLGITADGRSQWTAFSRCVLAQIERICAAGQAARNSAVSDPARQDLKRELIRQIIVTPGLLSQAAKDSYVVLTPQAAAPVRRDASELPSAAHWLSTGLVPASGTPASAKGWTATMGPCRDHVRLNDSASF
jgi:hypothetical protein